MLEHNIAQPSNSSWASPCVLVIKPDKTLRPCTDFRKVNNITKPDFYPLSQMKDCVDQVGTAKLLHLSCLQVFILTLLCRLGCVTLWQHFND